MGRENSRTLHKAIALRRQARGSRLSELDVAKEELAYFKLVQGIAIVSFISLVGWVVSTANSARRCGNPYASPNRPTD
jgi:hypothetical protein